MSQLKVKDIGSSEDSCFKLFEKRGFRMCTDIGDADIVVFNGGADIGTEIYNQKLVTSRIFNEDGNVLLASEPSYMSARDKQEILLYKRAKALGKFIVGVCRGAQLINCLEGGTLWQHVNNHNTSHAILDLKTNIIWRSTSVHHQMMRPPKNADIIAVASEATFKIDAQEQKRLKNFDRPLDQGDDPEVVWFKDARALCVQGHPEYAPESLFADYFFDLVDGLYAHGVWPPQKAASVAAL